MAWRVEKDWIDAQLAKIAAGSARLEQLLLGYAVTGTGETAYERLERENLLGPPREGDGPVPLRRIGPMKHANAQQFVRAVGEFSEARWPA